MDGSSFLASFKAAAASSTKEMIQFSGSIDSFPIRGDEVFINIKKLIMLKGMCSLIKPWKVFAGLFPINFN